MTGQVKEDLISRFGELGVSVKNGQLSFVPKILRNEEFLTNHTVFEYVNLENQVAKVAVPNGGLAFTYCQVPVVYQRSASAKIEVVTTDGIEEIQGDSLSVKLTTELFRRTNYVKQITVSVVK